MLPKQRPIHPGEFIKEDILKEFGLTQQQLADRLKVHRRTVNELVRGKRSISADMALRLGKFTNTSPQMWLNLPPLICGMPIRRRKDQVLDV